MSQCIQYHNMNANGQIVDANSAIINELQVKLYSFVYQYINETEPDISHSIMYIIIIC